MSKNHPPESRQDELENKLVKLQKATVAVEMLLFGGLAHSACRSAIKPDWKSVKLPLWNLTAVYGIHCEELARILTTNPKLQPDSTPVQDASHWLFCEKNKIPAELKMPAGLIAIQKATETGDTTFFIQLGEHLRNLNRKPAKQSKREIISEAKWILMFWWRPDSSSNWPGLAYCKPSAQWDFFGICLPGFSRDHGDNYLDNLRHRMGLIHSKHCFISDIKVKAGKLRFI